ncbi:zinc-binding alcohol dehydrogenase family protein [Rhizobium sullae]|uniref:Zinc-type alcohol dehydrogenase-like protein n=1 Tax=Rhizobium sullae TaxID=50338 RepID=A0A4R3PS76_RHISU|nr:zinc-binding alcohol dehydrogenase family protein [Rhizobium sullae]TCU06296.1 zinc-binding alcohol dehydrogenase family protein [Rhizobium sullae]
MKAIGHFKALPVDNAEALVDLELPKPTPGTRDLLVAVEAISVNPADFRVRGRKVDDGQAAILGWDVAGTVVGMGDEVDGFALGDAVYYAGDLTRPGANSEYHAADHRIVGHRPARLSAIEAAALPLTVLTAWEALFERLGLSPEDRGTGKTLLIVGGAGGTGSVAIQLARLVPDLTVIATASRPESRTWCEKLGAHAVIDHFGDMPAQLAAFGRTNVDLVLILNDPDRHYPALAEILTPQGKICSIVPFTGSPEINLIMQKSATFVWEFMFTRSMFGTPDIDRQRVILNSAAKLIDDGRLISTLSESLGSINSANLRAAHARLESGRTIGKIVLSGF